MAARADVEYGLRVTGTSSDNIERVANDGASERVLATGVFLEVLRETRRVDLDLLADLEYRSYLDDSFKDESIPSLIGQGELAFVPDVFSWVVEDRLGQLVSNPLQVQTPDNRAITNSFYTGPRLRLPVSDRSALQLDTRYGRNDFDVLETDNDAYTAQLGLVRQVSKNRALSVNAQYDDVRYDDDEINVDFERTSYFFSVESEISKGSLIAELGVNNIEYGLQDRSGTLASLTFSRDLTARTTLRLGFDQRFSEAGEIFRRQSGDDRFFTRAVNLAAVGGSPFEFRRLGGSLTFEGRELDWFVSLSRQDEKPLPMTVNFPRKLDELRLAARWQFSRFWQAQLIGEFRASDFSSLVRDDDDSDIGLTISRQISRVMYLDAGYRYFRRQSTIPDQRFKENRFLLAFRIDTRP